MGNLFLFGALITVGILSDSTFPNTFLHFRNFLGTNSLIFLWSSSISSFLPQSSLSSTAYLTIFSSSRVATLFPFSTSLDFVLLHKGGHLIIFTSPVSQLISRLCAYNHGIPSITSVFPKSHTSILILST